MYTVEEIKEEILDLYDEETLNDLMPEDDDNTEEPSEATGWQ